MVYWLWLIDQFGISSGNTLKSKCRNKNIEIKNWGKNKENAQKRAKKSGKNSEKVKKKTGSEK